MQSVLPFFSYLTRSGKRTKFTLPVGLNSLLAFVFFSIIPFINTYAQTGAALNFDGVDDYVDLGTSLGTFGTSDFTVEASFRTSNPDAVFITRRNDCVSGPFWTIKLAGGTFYIEVQENGQNNRIDVQTTKTYNDDNWHHMAFVRAGTTLTVYVDGVVAATKTGTGGTTNLNTSDIPLYLGNMGGNCSINRYKGDMDEVRLWTVARTASQIAEKQNCELTGNETGLIAYYNFNQGTGGGTNTGLTSLISAVSSTPVNGTLSGFSLTSLASNWIVSGAATKCVNCNTFVTRTTANGLGGNTVNKVFVAGNMVYAATSGGLSISTDGGQTFVKNTALDALARSTGTPSTAKPIGVVQNVYASGSTIYATVSGGLSQPSAFMQYLLAKSVDGGQSFTILNNSVYEPPSFFIGGNIIIVPGGSTQYDLSTNGGKTFTHYSVSQNVSKTMFTGLSGVNGKLYMTARLGVIAPKGGLYVSTDNGQTFTLNSNLSSALNGVAVYAVDNMIYYAAFTGLFISADGGATFTQRTTANGLGSNKVNHVFAIKNRVYAATDNGLSISTDGGQTFTNYTTVHGLGSNIVNSVYVVGTNVYAATDAGLSIANFAVQTSIPTNNTQITTAITIAPGQSATLTAAAANTTYAWSTGSNARTITANTTDLYSVTATGECPGTYSVQVTVLQANAGTTTTQTPLSATNCPVKLTATNLSGQRFQATGPGSYIFSDAYPGTVTNKEITLTNIRQPGTYTLRSVNASGVTTAVNTFNVSGSGCN